MAWILPIAAYLIGSIPFGVLISRSKGIDITRHGSGNVGATNVFRIVGKRFGVLCLILDFFKGFLPAAIAINLLRVQGETPPLSLPFLWGMAEGYPADRQLEAHTIQIITAMAAIVGHNYSIFLKFKGGKGIATSAGVLAALMPLILLGMVIVWIATFFLSGYVSLASILAALSLPILRHLGDRLQHVNHDKSLPSLWEAGSWNKPLLVFAVVACLLAVWRHHANIRRLVTGTENRITRKRKKPRHDS